MSVIRLKHSDGQEVNVLINNISHFTPILNDGDHVGSNVYLNSGKEFRVVETNRSIRNTIKKITAPKADEAETA